MDSPLPSPEGPSDDILTEQGLAPAAHPGAEGRVLLIACGALAHEILALKRMNGWDHLDLQCLPANLHLWPDRIPDARHWRAVAGKVQGTGRRNGRRPPLLFVF